MRNPYNTYLFPLPIVLLSFPLIYLVRNIPSLLLTLLVCLAFVAYYFLDKKNSLLAELNEKSLALDHQKNELEEANRELAQKNTRLDLLNKKLVDEMAEREKIQNFSFARDRYLANITNEMRNPLNNINQLTNMLLESNPRPDQAETMRSLQFSVNDLVVFINDILHFSKIEAGKVNLSERSFNLKTTLTGIGECYLQLAKDKNLLFNLELAPDVPHHLLGDPGRLSQILSSLVSRIIQQTDEGMVDVHVSVENPRWSTITLKMAVSGTDNGKGLPELKAIHQTQPDEEDKGSYDKEEFSMAIVQRLIELQNGTLEVESRPGLGTSVIVSLPLKNVDSEKNKTGAAARHNFSDLAGNNVLLVEDNPVNQLVVANMLRKVGMQVTTANNGKEALELFEQKDFDLVLMDVLMPVMNGYQATAEIRRHPDANKYKVPIIALTASAFLTAKDKAKLFGMNDHVGKPFSPEELLEKISACLELCKAA